MRYNYCTLALASFSLIASATANVGLDEASSSVSTRNVHVASFVSPVKFAPREVFKRALTPDEICGRNYVWCEDFSHCCGAGQTCMLESSQYICRGGTNGDPFYDTPEGGKDGLSTGVIIGIVVGGVVVIAAICAAIFFIVKRQKKNSKDAAAVGGVIPPLQQQPVQQQPQQQQYMQPQMQQQQQYVQPQHGYPTQPQYQQYPQQGYAPQQQYAQPVAAAPQYSPSLGNGPKEPDSTSYYAPQAGMGTQSAVTTPGAGGQPQYYQAYQGGTSGGYQYPTGGAVETNTVPHVVPNQAQQQYSPTPGAYEIGNGR